MRFFFLVTCFILSCCDSSDRARLDSLVGVNWNLVAVERAGVVVEQVEEGDFVLVFQEDGELKGNELCNGCGGTYEIIGGDTLSLNAGCTEIGCPKYSLYVLSRFPYGTSRFQIRSGELRLQIADTDLVYVYR